MRGIIRGFDNFVVILESDGKQQMIYKHAISTHYSAARGVDLFMREEEHVRRNDTIRGHQHGRGNESSSETQETRQLCSPAVCDRGGGVRHLLRFRDFIAPISAVWRPSPPFMSRSTTVLTQSGGFSRDEAPIEGRTGTLSSISFTAASACRRMRRWRPSMRTKRRLPSAGRLEPLENKIELLDNALQSSND